MKVLEKSFYHLRVVDFLMTQCLELLTKFAAKIKRKEEAVKGQKKEKVNLDAVVEFYNPRWGLGAAISLPLEVKKVVNEIDGKTMSLREAVEKIKQTVKGARGMSVKVVDEYKYIALECVVPDDNPSKHKWDHAVHCWKLISYREL